MDAHSDYARSVRPVGSHVGAMAFDPARSLASIAKRLDPCKSLSKPGTRFG
jgi:hypothetical protein